MFIRAMGLFSWVASTRRALAILVVACSVAGLAIASTPSGDVNSGDGSLSGITTADIGTVDAATSTDAVHIFELVNDTSSTVQVSGVRGTCGCEKLALLDNGRAVEGYSVPVGGQIEVQMAVRLEGQSTGNIRKTAYVLGGKSGSQILNALTLVFNVRRPIAFTQSELEFGDVQAGAQATGIVTLSIDKEFAKDKEILPIVSDSPYVTIGTPLAIPDNTIDGHTMAGASYLITLNHLSQLGAFQSRLELSYKDSNGVPQVITCPVLANIIGSFTVSPRAINFGVVRQGSVETREMLLTVKSTDDLKNLSLTTHSTFITPRAEATLPIGAEAPACVISISLSATAPLGSLGTNLTIRCTNGDTLIVPVSAEVTAQ